MKYQGDTDFNVQRSVKKAAIGWIVPTILGLICLGFLALSRAQVQGMLDSYQTKSQATELEVEHDRKEERLQHEVEALQDTLNVMDKKLDHLQYTVDFVQEHRPLRPPKDNPP